MDIAKEIERKLSEWIEDNIGETRPCIDPDNIKQISEEIESELENIGVLHGVSDREKELQKENEGLKASLRWYKSKFTRYR